MGRRQGPRADAGLIAAPDFMGVSKPDISVVLPTFNRRRWLGEAVRSVLTQTFPDFELLVIDDGSTDGSIEALPHDPRLTVVRRPHTGNVGTLHQIGLGQSAGRLVAFLDSDDRWPADSLERRSVRLLENPSCGWCYGRYQLVDERGEPLPHHAGSSRIGSDASEVLLRQLLTTEIGIPLETVLVRRDVVLQMGGFDERLAFGDDYDFVLRLAQAAPVCAVDAVVAEAREHPDRGSHRRYDQALAFVRAYRKCAMSVEAAELRRICRRRAIALSRYYLARARADGVVLAGVWRLARSWFAGDR